MKRGSGGGGGGDDAARLAPEYFSISLTLLTNSKEGRTDNGAQTFFFVVVADAVSDISNSGWFNVE